MKVTTTISIDRDIKRKGKMLAGFRNTNFSELIERLITEATQHLIIKETTNK